MDDGREELLELRSTWPASTIDGEPGLQEGGMFVIREPDGSVLLSGSDGPAGSGPEEHQYWELVMSPEQADQLLEALQRSRR